MKGGPPGGGAAAMGIPQQTATKEGGAPGKKRGVMWWGAVAFGVGATAGVAMGVDQLRRARMTVANTPDQNPVILQAVPDVPVSRSVRIYPNLKKERTISEYYRCIINKNESCKIFR